MRASERVADELVVDLKKVDARCTMHVDAKTWMQSTSPEESTELKMNTIQFPVLLESNEVLTLLLDKETALKAIQDEQFLRNLVTEYQINAAGQDNVPNYAAGVNEVQNSKGFTWPDIAVLLLIETYRAKESEFTTGMKRHNVVWKEIAAELNEANYATSGLQCSVKYSGLRRTYKNIHEQNKKATHIVVGPSTLRWSR